MASGQNFKQQDIMSRLGDDMSQHGMIDSPHNGFVFPPQKNPSQQSIDINMMLKPSQSVNYFPQQSHSNNSNNNLWMTSIQNMINSNNLGQNMNSANSMTTSFSNMGTSAQGYLVKTSSGIQPAKSRQISQVILSPTNNRGSINENYLRKNELVQKIGNQIERNIKEETSMRQSLDTFSQNGRVTPRGGSPKLNEIRSMNKTRQSTAQLQISLSKCADNNQGEDERVDTEISAVSAINFNHYSIPPTNNNSAFPHLGNTSFDVKEYMKQGILNKGTYNSLQNQPDQTPAFSLVKQSNQYFPQKLTTLDEGQISAFRETKETQQSQLSIKEEDMITSRLKRNHAYSQSLGGYYDMGGSHQHLLSQENKCSQFKNMASSKQNDGDDSESRSNSHQDSKHIRENSYPYSISSKGSKKVSDFISKINVMLKRSASINQQVEKSMIESEKNLLHLSHLHNQSGIKNLTHE